MRPATRTLALVATLAACGRAVTQRPNVLLVTIESLRPDHVSCYGSARPLTPNLDALAAEGVLYTDAHSVTSWTLAAHASLFTGLYPSAHHATAPLGRLGDSQVTLAEMLAEAGYQTAAVVSGPYLRRAHNLHQGFELYEESPSAATNAAAHASVTSPAMLLRLRAFLEQRDPARPFFLFAYFWDPHYDYIPPAPYDRAFVESEHVPIDVHGYEARDVVHAGITPGELGYVLSQYDGEIRWTDRHLGLLFRSLKEQGLWRETLVIVTADHGEAFFEHGEKGHKHDLYRESVHVPLVIKYPRSRPAGREGRLASLVDVLPTVLDVAGVRPGTPVQGVSLLAPQSPARAILLELDSVWYPERAGGEPRVERWVALRRGEHELVALPDLGRFELYDTQADPRERTDRAAARPKLVSELRGELDRLLRVSSELGAGHASGGQAELDEEGLAELRALGYAR